MDLSWRVWRHPRAAGVAGRCIGVTDVPVDARKAKRLAHRIRAAARREGGAREVWTSPLSRCADVGRWLRRFGWRHRIDARLLELDFGDWDGRGWDTIGATPVAAWCERFAEHAPGGGESVEALLARCASFFDERRGDDLAIVAHAGWINAMRWTMAAKPPPHRADEWPAAAPHAQRVRLTPAPRDAAPPAPNRTNG